MQTNSEHRRAAAPLPGAGEGIAREAELIALAGALIGSGEALTDAEAGLLGRVREVPDPQRLATIRVAILAGGDPLGEGLCRIRSPGVRRQHGATYTPRPIVGAMLAWAAAQRPAPVRIVDPGAGSGRFLVAAAACFASARLVAIELDPLPALLLRANAAVRGFADRLELRLEDYRDTELPPAEGATLFIGNPPYVRHHRIDAERKRWFADAARRRGLKASKLAGLHVHFFLQTLLLSRPGDYGSFVTAAEWLDVNYGSVVRALLSGGLGAESLHLLDPAALPFEDAATTAVITCFRTGHRGESLRVRAVANTSGLGDLSAGAPVAISDAARCGRWSSLVRAAPRPPAGDVETGHVETGHVELGELFRVHRGQATGCNDVWIEGEHSHGLPERVLLPTVTRAKELFAAAGRLEDARPLRRIIDLPPDLGGFSSRERRAIERFLDWARRQGAADTYIARHRSPWWAVRLRAPAPILCTYMARRPPAFVLNHAGARHINIAHGLYPREPMPAAMLATVVAWLNAGVGVEAGRTYSGGLTKFEPREIERLTLPPPLLCAREISDEHRPPAAAAGLGGRGARP